MNNQTDQAQRRPLFVAKRFDKDFKPLEEKAKPIEPITKSKPVDPLYWEKFHKMLFERIRREMESGRAQARIAEMRERSRLAELEFKAGRTGRYI